MAKWDESKGSRRVRLTGPYELNDVVGLQGEQHVKRLLEASRKHLESMSVGVATSIPNKLGIVGAGVMGTAIAALALQQGLNVAITDSSQTMVARAHDIVRRLVPPDQSIDGSLEVTHDLRVIMGCDMVLEAVVEDPAKKAVVLRELDEGLPAERLLATNTSTIPIHRLAGSLQNPERLCGTHFFLPIHERLVVEVIFTPETSTEIRSAAIGLTTALGRNALLAPDVVGFVVNRLMMPYVSEAMQLLTEGIEAERIEEVAVAFGMPKGPLSLLDEIGLDTALDCGWVFSGAYEDRVAVSPLLVAMVKSGRLGQKSGAGFFRYVAGDDGETKQETDSVAGEIVARWVRDEGEATADEIAARLFLPMLFEGARILQEHEDCRASDVDLGAVLGLGMAPARGGPLFWCEQVGADRMLEIAEPFRRLGLRMEPPESLRHMAHSGARYYDDPTQVGAREDWR